MTVVRSLALGISERVTRWSSPACREWAEGQARELAYIENDWRALAWALGSTRVLLERRGIQAESDQGIKPRRPRMIDVAVWLWYFELSVRFAVDVVKARSPWNRTAAYLCALASAYFIVNSIADWRRERWEPPILSDAYLPFRRKELELSLARSRSVRRWFPSLAVASGITGWVMQIEGGMHLHHTSSRVWIVIGVLMIGGRWSGSSETIQKQITQLDERIAKTQIEKAERIARGGRDKPAHSDQWGRSGEVALESAPEIIQLRLR